VESIPQYTPHRRHFKARCSIPGFTGPPSTIPTLNFAKNAKFRMGHPTQLMEVAGYAERS
jgi:hypothetical protein